MLFRTFYPGDAGAQIAAFLATSVPGSVPERTLHVAVVPHAGWRYSGAVAARALKALAEHSRPRSILLLGAVHRVRLRKAALYPAGGWETPLGRVPVDAALAAEVERALGGLVEPNPAAHDTEHSLEVELPLLHEVLPGVPVVPIMVPPEGLPAEVGRRLARLVEGREVVAIASTDLTHYGDSYLFTPWGGGEAAHERMRENDRRILDLAIHLEAERIPEEAEENRNACGAGALAAAVAFARELGSKDGCVLERTDSHEVAGKDEPFRTAVGYAGVVF